MNLLDQYMDMLGDAPLTDEDIMREIFAAELSEFEERVMELTQEYTYDSEEEYLKREDNSYENVTITYQPLAALDYVSMTLSLVPP